MTALAALRLKLADRDFQDSLILVAGVWCAAIVLTFGGV